MNNTDERYAAYSLVREMMQTPEVIRSFDVDRARELGSGARPAFLTGEGSSRIFPAKRSVAQALRDGRNPGLMTEGSTQAAEYNLAGFEVYAASNSGRTAEVVRLIKHLHSTSPRPSITAVVANGESPVGEMADRTFVLDCGQEKAVAATMSVVEQALFYHVALNGGPDGPQLAALAEGFNEALAVEIPRAAIEAASTAGTIYFAGRNDGVAEELALKANEITRKKSDFLEGTYAVHGIEEVMDKNDVLVLIDPFQEEETKIQSVLAGGVGLTIVAVAARDTRFPTVRVPNIEGLGPYVQLAAGWNLLVEIGLACGVDLDKPVRARKVGNEFTE